jgi:hypothetical protein
MKIAALLLISLSPLYLFSQTDFTVAAGAQRTLTAAERTLSLKTLSLGDNCVIIIPRDMDGWTVTAADASIGTGVRIMGRGVDGNNSAGWGAGSAGSAPNCMAGMNGGPGANGANGTAGKSVSLNLKIRKIGSLLIDVAGGNAGRGGAGGTGGRGGDATCTCNAGAGGNGGNGGRGGNGGYGGNVTISYSVIGKAVVSAGSFTIQNDGGALGVGGASGMGGTGGKGNNCSDPKSAIRPAGANGSSGRPGVAGFAGGKGITTIQSR